MIDTVSWARFIMLTTLIMCRSRHRCHLTSRPFNNQAPTSACHPKQTMAKSKFKYKVRKVFRTSTLSGTLIIQVQAIRNRFNFQITEVRLSEMFRKGLGPRAERVSILLMGPPEKQKCSTLQTQTSTTVKSKTSLAQTAEPDKCRRARDSKRAAQFTAKKTFPSRKWTR